MTIPKVTTEQMIAVDNLMAAKMGIDTTIMMEHAALAVANTAKLIIKNSIRDKFIVVLAHKGNNGGDGLAAARILANWGAKPVNYLTADQGAFSQAARKQLEILKNMGIPIFKYNDDWLKKDLLKADLIIDALLGFNLKADPKEPLKSAINIANSSRVKILSVDIPSGLNADSGEPADPTVKATATITLGLPKQALLKPNAKDYVGELYLGDIGITQGVYEELDIKPPAIFDKNSVVRIDNE